MKREVREAGGQVESLDDMQFAPHVLNVRFRLEAVSRAGSGEPIREGDPAFRINRYSLCRAKSADDATAAGRWVGRRGLESPPAQRADGTWVQTAALVRWSPEHDRLQAKLMRLLKERNPTATVVREQDFIDVSMSNSEGLWLFEIKSDLCPLSAVRQALGQIIEYALHPRRVHATQPRLVIVGRRPLEGEDIRYFEVLKATFAMPLDYWPLDIES